MRQSRSAITAGAVTVAIIVAAAPAHATIQKTGYKACSVGEVVVLQAHGDGDIRFYTGGTLRDTRYNVPLSYWTYRTRSRTVNWKITSTGSLYDAGTKGTCVDANIPQVGEPEDPEES